MNYFEDQVHAGEWDEVERYLCGFTKVEDNQYSMKIFFEIRKQKYLEALDRQVKYYIYISHPLQVHFLHKVCLINI
ncbi:putative Topless family protein [Helianthus anomalus]